MLAQVRTGGRRKSRSVRRANVRARGPSASSDGCGSARRTIFREQPVRSSACRFTDAPSPPGSHDFQWTGRLTNRKSPPSELLDSFSVFDRGSTFPPGFCVPVPRAPCTGRVIDGPCNLCTIYVPLRRDSPGESEKRKRPSQRRRHSLLIIASNRRFLMENVVDDVCPAGIHLSFLIETRKRVFNSISALLAVIFNPTRTPARHQPPAKVPYTI